MKKLLKKIIMTTLALMITISSIHFTSVEAEAAPKTYRGYVTLSAKMPGCISGEVVVTTGNGGASTGWIAPRNTGKVTLNGTFKSNESALVNVKAETSSGTFYTSFRVKAKDLKKNKKFKLKFKTKGIGTFQSITKIYI